MSNMKYHPVMHNPRRLASGHSLSRLKEVLHRPERYNDLLNTNNIRRKWSNQMYFLVSKAPQDGLQHFIRTWLVARMIQAVLAPKYLEFGIL